MPRRLLDLAADLARRGEPFALASAVGRAPISAQLGDRALVTQPVLRPPVVVVFGVSPTARARRSRAVARPRLVRIVPQLGI